MKKFFTKLVSFIALTVLAPIAAYAERMFCMFVVVAAKSAPLTNADASLSRLNSASVDRARMLTARGVVSVANPQSIGSTFRMFRVRSGDMIHAILLDCTAITGAAADIGIYRTTMQGGAAVDADFFGSAVSLATAVANLDVTRESGVLTVANMERPLWQALGLAADPSLEYDVTLTLTAGATAAGNICLRGEFNGSF
jgi:hypothetical protein